MKKIVATSLVALYALTNLQAASTSALEAKLTALESELKDIKSKIKKNKKTINKVKAHDAFDNVKFDIDFRNTYDHIDYKNNETGEKFSNNSLYTSRLLLNMKSSPIDGLTFTGQLAAYYLWGSHVYEHDTTLKGWSASSKPTDTIFRVRRAYFVWTDSFGEDGLPYSFSIGRRPSSDGFLANHRENMKEPASPLAHITNMEVDAAMFKLNTDEYLTGSFIKFVYGRAHSGGIESVYDKGGYRPFAQAEGDENENVDFFVAVASLYNDGQYNLMFQHATIFDTKGARSDTPAGPGNKSLDAGKAYLNALSLQVDGVGNEINDFLDNTTLFASVAMSKYDPDTGHQLLGSTDSETGYSYWLGAVVPTDFLVNDSKFGIEYNHGSKYWTPMTWSEDTSVGSKIAVRGDAIEAYWNFNLFGVENLPAQIRYTHLQHDYTPNIRCSGWVTPKPVDIEADDLRLSVSYKY